MIGTIVNVVGIVAGSVIGAILGKKLVNSYQESLFIALGGCVGIVGLKVIISSINNDANILLLIVNMCLGALIGNYFKLHDRFIKLSERLKAGNNFGEGLITAILLFCIGALSILGPIESALKNDHTMLFINASLDFVSSIALASAYGVGIALAAPVLFIFQGAIYMCALIIKDSIPEYILSNLTLTGGLLIIFSSIVLLKIKSIKTTDYLPALFLSIITSIIVHDFIKF
ncbi:MAG: DUF554 domain-containing protein [Succinivibrionaceae bacterium]